MSELSLGMNDLFDDFMERVLFDVELSPEMRVYLKIAYFTGANIVLDTTFSPIATDEQKRRIRTVLEDWLKEVQSFSPDSELEAAKAQQAPDDPKNLH